MERNTRQREAIRDVLREAGAPLSPREVHASARKKVRGVGIATVYRTLKSLLDEGFLVSVELPGETPRYELSGKEHHHHFTCTACKRVFEIHGCPGDLKHLVPEGFVLTDHDVVLSGLCAACARRR